jgi:sugar phosphate isomerase/epimerase
MKEIEGYGLGVSGYAPSFVEVPPAEVAPEDYLRVFRKSLAFCVNCGISTLRIDTVSPPIPLSPEEYTTRFNCLTKTWHQATQEAAGLGIGIVWEFEPGFWLNKPSEVIRVVEAVDHENFKLLFDTSHAYMGGVVGARQTGKKEILKGGVTEYGLLLDGMIGHLHLIDSDGSLHHNETSTHTAFGHGKINFLEVLTAIKPAISQLPWWCVDFCFNPETPTAGKEAVLFVRRVMEEVLP